MSSDVIGDPIIGDPNIPEPLVVKVKPVILHAMALTTLIEHGMKQSKIVQEMLVQATFALERARAASNEGAGSVLKMVVPIMIERKKYLSREIQMWALVMEAAEAELNDLKPELDEIDAANAAREAKDGREERLLGDVGEPEPVDDAGQPEGCDCGSPCDECDGAHDPDETPNLA